MNIEVDYKWDKDAFIKASMANMKYRFGGVKSFVVSIIILAFLAFSLYIAIEKGMEPIYYLFIFLAVYWFILRWPIYKWSFNRQFNKHTEKNAIVSWSIDENGLRGKGSNSSGEFSWESITDAIKSKYGYLIYRYPMFHWFPYTAFKNESDMQLFEELLTKNVKKHKITT